MTRNNKIILAIALIAFIAGLCTGVGTTSGYIRHHTSYDADTVYVERLIEVTASNATKDIYKSKSFAELPKKELQPTADTSVFSIRKDSVIVKGIEPLSGAKYEATVTGIQPTLERLNFTIPERVVTKTIVKPLSGWSIGIFGDGIYQQYKFDAKAGLYASYTAGPFCLHFDAGAIWSDLGPNNAISPYIGAGVRIELFRKR